MVILEAIGIASKEIFDYNRENFKFDQEQRLKKDLSRVEMQIKRFDLFRQDIEDLVKLTVDKMDAYQLIGALFLGFTTTIFCEGRVVNPPNWFNGLYLLSVSSAFVYLLLAVWLSMHASISSHSFGVRLRTRYVRLPIPSLSQIASLTAKLSDFENQNVREVMRVPFATPAQQWTRSNAQQGGGGHDELGHGEDGFGREDVATSAASALPGKHVHLFRRLQAKWQSYDAYARVAMALGAHQMLNSLNYFMVGVNTIKWRCPSTAIACTIVFQTAAMAMGILDVSGWSQLKVALLSLMGSSPIVIILVILAVANNGRLPEDSLDLHHSIVYAAPAAYLLQSAWFWMLLTLAEPSNDEAGLPRRYRAVLYLDVFGDASFDPTEMENVAVLPAAAPKAVSASKGERQQYRAAAAENALSTAQEALRRWEAVPTALLSAAQQEEIGRQRREYTFWRRTFHGHIVQEQPSYDTFARDKQDLRPWAELSSLERQEDEFAEALLGPLSRNEGGEVRTVHYNLEAQEQVWEQVIDQRVLTLQELAGLIRKTKGAVQTMIRKSQAQAGDATGPAETTSEDEGDTDEEEDLADSDSSEEGTSTSKSAVASRSDRDSLPWKITRRMTKVMALCWAALGVELIIHHQISPPVRREAERRLRQRSEPSSEAPTDWSELHELQVAWPHKAFFQPATLSCLERPSTLLIGTRYRLYNGTLASSPARMSMLPRYSFPPNAVALCPSVHDLETSAKTSACLLGALVQDGIAVWPVGSDPQGEEAVVLPVHSKPWRFLTGASVPCAEAAGLMARSPEAAWCLLFAGWDGEHVLVAAAPLPDGPAAVPSKVRLVPRLDVPLMHPSMRTAHARQPVGKESMVAGNTASGHAVSSGSHANGDTARTHLTALHLDARQGHLWVLYSTGSLEAWDLYTFRGMGPWQLRLPQMASFHAIGLCAESRDSLLLMGTDDEVGPRMFRIQGLVRSSLQDNNEGSKASKAVLSKRGSNNSRL